MYESSGQNRAVPASKAQGRKQPEVDTVVADISYMSQVWVRGGICRWSWNSEAVPRAYAGNISPVDMVYTVGLSGGLRMSVAPAVHRSLGPSHRGPVEAYSHDIWQKRPTEKSS